MANDRVWEREKGNILVPKAMSKKDIEKEKKLVTPEYFWFQQQGVGRSSDESAIKSEHFLLVENPVFRGATVISIDAAQRDGLTSSYNVIQVWNETNKNYHLVDQFREQCSFVGLEKAAKHYIKYYRPAAVLIENAANGGALMSRLKKIFKTLNIKSIQPSGSKAERLNRHRATIRHGVVSLPAHGDWVENYIEEFLKFPAGDSDQIDATTQFLDFMITKPKLENPEPRATIAGVYSNLLPIQPQPRNPGTAPSAVGLALGSLSSRLRRI